MILVAHLLRPFTFCPSIRPQKIYLHYEQLSSPIEQCSALKFINALCKSLCILIKSTEKFSSFEFQT